MSGNNVLFMQQKCLTKNLLKLRKCIKMTQTFFLIIIYKYEYGQKNNKFIVFLISHYKKN